MKERNCKIGQIKFKNGPNIRVLETPKNPLKNVIYIGDWGKVTIEFYDDEDKALRRDTACYILDAAKEKLKNGDVESD